MEWKKKQANTVDNFINKNSLVRFSFLNKFLRIKVANFILYFLNKFWIDKAIIYARPNFIQIRANVLWILLE